MLFLPQTPLGENLIVFTTSIHGGVSEKAFKSFNLGAHVGDDLLRVQTNRALLDAIIAQQTENRFINAANVKAIKWLNQQHSTHYTNYEDANDKPCDAIFTNQALTPLVVMTADCLPIVIYCSKTYKIAAVHAGWRGLVNGIVPQVLQEFDDTQALHVWAGPSISQENFEVTDDVLPLFSGYLNSVKKNKFGDKSKIDLRCILHQQLSEHGVSQLEISDVCTYVNRSCFSHRRSQHQGIAHTGRMATVILRLSEVLTL